MLQKSKPYGFTAFARRYGEQALLDCLERNEQKGVVYHREGIWGDYDQFDDVEELLRFIKTGESGKDKEALKKMTHLEQMVGELLDQAKVCFIAYLDDEGYPVTKAMLQPRERNNLGEIWFSTNTSSQIERIPKPVCTLSIWSNLKGSAWLAPWRYWKRRKQKSGCGGKGTSSIISGA